MAKKLPIRKAGPAGPKKDENAEAKAADKKPGKPVKGAAAKSRAKASESTAKKAAEVKPLRGGIPFICSECYEEFILPATYSRETVTCPDCMHVGKRPAEDFLRTVNLHKSEEKKSLSQASAFAVMLGLDAILLLWAVSPYPLPAQLEANKDTVWKVLLGLVVILTGALLFSVSKYEKNRWEIYF